MNDLISFQFETRDVRIVMLGGEPWWIATDLAALLEYKHTPHMVRMVKPHESAVHKVDTSTQRRDVTIISEPGMWKCVFRSKAEAAQRIVEWLAGEVLPTLRKTGRYVMFDDAPPMVASDLDPPRLMAGVAVVREARRLFGPQAARNLWPQVGLPPVLALQEGEDSDPLADPLRIWLDARAETTIGQAADGIGLRDIDQTTRFRIGRLLKNWGWIPVNKKVAGNKTARVFQRPSSPEAQL